MRSVERPRRARWAMVLGVLAAAIVMAVVVVPAGADGVPEGLRIQEETAAAEVALPIVLVPFDMAAAEAVQIRALILDAAQRRGLDGELLLQIAQCESRLNPRITGPGGATGLFQIIPSTWEWATGRLGMIGASPIDPVANVEVAAWLMETMGAGQWPSC